MFRRRVTALLALGFVCLVPVSIVRAQPAPTGEEFVWPDQLTPESMATVDGWLAGLGNQPDWKTVFATLDAQADTPPIRYARARAHILRGAVWDGHRAIETLRQLQQEASTRGDSALASRLLLAMGGGQLAMHHNADALQTLEEAVRELRKVGDTRGLTNALHQMSSGLIHHSRRPQDALPYINELLVTAHRLGLKNYEALAARLYDEWRKLIHEVDDYFGRASNRLQYFTPVLGIPADADLVAFVDGVLIMNGDTDDQVPAAAPEFFRFDGSFVSKLKLPSDSLELRGSMVDDRNRLWAATNRGLYLYDSKKFVQLCNPALGDEDGNELSLELERSSGSVEVRTVPLLSNIVNEVKQGTDGRIYLATGAGVSIFRPGTEEWIHFTDKDAPIPHAVERVAPVPDGSLVVAWRDAFAIRTKNGDWKRMPFRFPPLAGRPNPKLFGLLVDRDGHPWVHGLGGGLQLEGNRISRWVDARFAAITRNVNHVLKASDGAYWFASTDGVCRQEGNHCASLHSKRWLPAEWSLDLLEGPPGHIWLSVYQGGLNHFMPPHYRHYGVPDGLRQPVNYTVDELGGYLFLANGEGLARLDPATGQVDNFISDAEGIPPGELNHSLRLSTGKLVYSGPDVLDQKGIVLFDGRRGTPIAKREGLPDEKVRDFCEPRKGTVLVASRTRLSEVDASSRLARPATGYGALARKRILSVECAPGEPLWALTLDKQVYRAEDGRVTQVPAEETGIEGEPTRLIRTEKAGVFLFGQRNIARFQDGKWRPVPVDADSFDFRVRDVVSDEKNRLYFSTESGVFVFNGEDWARLTARDGLVSKTAFQMLYLDGKLWITGHGGIADWRWPDQAPPETYLLVRNVAYHVDKNEKPHQWRVSNGLEKKGWVQLSGLAGNFEVPADRTASFLPVPESNQEANQAPTPDRPPPIEYDPEPYENNRLLFSLSANVPYMDDPPASFHYHFRLDGGSWKKAEGQKLLIGDLSDGAHVIEVRATDPRLVRDPTPARYAFTVETPLSPWLLASMGLGLVVVVLSSRRRLHWLYLRWRHRRFTPIAPSPFTPNRPAQGEAFVGRQESIDQVGRMVKGSGGVAVAWGERGMGKHSLMKHLAGILEASEVLVVEVDLAIATAGGDVAQLVTSLTQSLFETLIDSGIEIEASRTHGGESIVPTTELVPDSSSSAGGSSGSAEKNPFNAFSLALRNLERAQPDVHVAFLLDNAEVLGVALDSDAGYGSYLFPFLRSLAQQQASVTVVLSMEGRWFDLSKRFGQLFGFATPVSVGRFPDEESTQLISHAVRDRALLAEKEMRRFIDLAGGHPYLLQFIGERLVSEMNARQTNYCSMGILDHVANSLVDDPDSGLKGMWLDLPREEKLIVAALCEQQHPGHESNLEAVVERLETAGEKLLYEEIRRAIISLEKGGTIQVLNGAIRLRGDLFCLWIRHHHSVESVMEESHDYVGHYQLVERLGAGGMGVVYKARDLVHGGTVALKLLRSELTESKRSRRRFLREAKLGKSIRHPGIVKILDYGEQAGRLYLAMEFVEGKTLSRWVRKKALSSGLVAALGKRLASALVAIHRVGIVHRDVKSDNIMVVANMPDNPDPDNPEQEDQHGLFPGAIKLMDFGLAVGQDVSRMTRAGSLLGTVAYMSPEQAKGEEVDARSDLYSLGVVLYELCTGTTPFKGPDAALLHSVIYDPVPPMRDKVDNIPDELASFIERLLSKNPDDRPLNARDVDMKLAMLAMKLAPTDDARLTLDSFDSMNRERSASSSGSSQGSRQSGVTSRTLEVLRSESALLASLSSASSGESSSLADAVHDVARLLLYRVSAAVARGTAEGDVMQECLEQVCEALEANRGLVFLANPDGGFDCVAAHNRGGDTLQDRPVLHSLLHQCVGKQIGLLYQSDAAAMEDWMGTAVVSPLWAGDRILGALLVDRTGIGAEPFRENDLELMAAIGYLMGLGIERERLTRQVIDQERLAAVGHMLAGVAHDLRAPMAVISGYAELITLEGEKLTREKQCNIIMRQVDEMNHMIGNLMAYVRGDTQLNATTVNIDDLSADIREMLSLQCEPKGVDLVVDTRGDKAKVDLSRTKRIIFNLARNALEALGDKGRLSVHLDATGDDLDIRIEDTGPGIPDSMRQKIFNPFFTSGKKAGTGLGLAIVQRFVNDHGGNISLESEEGQGTVFRVRLPKVP